MSNFLVKQVCRLYGLANYGRTGYSRPVEGNAGTMGLAEKLW